MKQMKRAWFIAVKDLRLPKSTTRLWVEPSGTLRGFGSTRTTRKEVSKQVYQASFVSQALL